MSKVKKCAQLQELEAREPAHTTSNILESHAFNNITAR